MCPRAISEEDSTAFLIRTRMPWRVAQVEALANFRLRVRFLDGTEGTVDMNGVVHSPAAGVFAALSDADRFAQLFVEHGAVTWPDVLDLAPDAMYRAIKLSGEWVLS